MPLEADGAAATALRDAVVGEPAADFVALYRHHYPRLVRALRLSGAAGDAEDLAQEAFARTLVHWWRVRHGSNPGGYPYRVAFRLARRRAGAERLLGDEEPPAAADAIGAATTRADLERTLAHMPPARRRCAVLGLLAGLPPSDVARALRIAPSTVRKQLSLARRDLRRSLADATDHAPARAACPVEPDGERRGITR